MSPLTFEFRLLFAMSFAWWLLGFGWYLRSSEVDATILKIEDYCEFSKMPEKGWFERSRHARTRTNKSHPPVRQVCRGLTVPPDLSANGYDKVTALSLVTVSYEAGQAHRTGQIWYSNAGKSRLQVLAKEGRTVRISYVNQMIEDSGKAKSFAFVFGFFLVAFAAVDAIFEIRGRSALKAIKTWLMRHSKYYRDRHSLRVKNADLIDKSVRQESNNNGIK
jgi:hypothetical protein